MREQSRREFLTNAAIAGGALALGPLGASAGEDALPVIHPAADAGAGMSITRWKGGPVSDEGVAAMAEKLTVEAIAGLGGMKRFVRSGDVVWIKPNMGWSFGPETAANTNPHVVAALVRLASQAGAKTVKVGDFSCNWWEQAYQHSRIPEAAEAAGAEIHHVDESRFRKVEIGGEKMKTWDIVPEMVDADLLINVPVAKTHGMCGITVCMKNLMGVIGHPRDKLHEDLPTYLCDLAAWMKPRLNVVDAVRVMFRDGPASRNPADVRRMDTVAAGTDIVALDAFGAELLDLDPGEMPTVTVGRDRGLGVMDYRSLEPVEIAVS